MKIPIFEREPIGMRELSISVTWGVVNFDSCSEDDIYTSSPYSLDLSSSEDEEISFYELLLPEEEESLLLLLFPLEDIFLLF